MGQISSAPVELIRVQRSGGKKWRGAVAEMQGWRADHEDAHFFRDSENGFATFGVLDGHGGCEVARLAAHDRLPEALLDAGKTAKNGHELEKKIEAAFIQTDAWLRERPEVTRDQSGSTCVVAGIRQADDTDQTNYEWYIANAGDSRGIIFRKNNTRPQLIIYSEDHKPDRQDEHARIAAAGGFVSDVDAARRLGGGLATVVARLDGNLAVSRGLGDFAYKRDDHRQPSEQKVSCVPEIYRSNYHSTTMKKDDSDHSYHTLKTGDILILACDGIFDVMSNEQLACAIATYLAQDVDLGDIASTIVSACLRELNSKDNMTLMIIQVGIDGTDYAYHKQPKKLLPPLLTLPGMKNEQEEDDGLPRAIPLPYNGSPVQDDEEDSAVTANNAKMDLDDEDEDDIDDENDQTIDEIVGIHQYDLQTDDSVKRSYISFLEYCQADKSRKLPREARSLLRRVAKEEARKHSAAREAIARKRFGVDISLEDEKIHTTSDDGSGTSSRR